MPPLLLPPPSPPPSPPSPPLSPPPPCARVRQISTRTGGCVNFLRLDFDDGSFTVYGDQAYGQGQAGNTDYTFTLLAGEHLDSVSWSRRLSNQATCVPGCAVTFITSYGRSASYSGSWVPPSCAQAVQFPSNQRPIVGLNYSAPDGTSRSRDLIGPITTVSACAAPLPPSPPPPSPSPPPPSPSAPPPPLVCNYVVGDGAGASETSLGSSFGSELDCAAAVRNQFSSVQFSSVLN